MSKEATYAQRQPNCTYQCGVVTCGLGNKIPLSWLKCEFESVTINMTPRIFQGLYYHVKKAVSCYLKINL